MHHLRKRLAAWIATITAVATLSAAAFASPALVVDIDSGDVLYQDAATTPWFPASTTKLMTVYVALSAVREGRITINTPLMVSPRAASMPPSKMGFRPGTLVTLDNALKMLMVKSPNDVAVTIAEGVSGSVENFANDMNVYAARLGLHESHFVNPNGLPDPSHVSSARDMAVIARALLRDYPDEHGLFSIGVLAFGNKLIRNHNGLLGRYPGANGMKTGFTCAAGYNVVASAERDGRHLITVIMGAPSSHERDQRAAALFDRFFVGGASSLGSLDGLPSSGFAQPIDNRDTICGHGRYTAIAEAEAEDAQIGPAGSESSLAATRVAFEPVRVFIGPVAGWSGRVAQAVGTGSKEYAAAPAKPTAFEQHTALATADPSGPAESAAPGPGSAPLALVGAAELPAAAVATRRLVRAAPGLGLSVGPRRRTARMRHSIQPVTATLTKPSLIAKADATPAKAKATSKPVVAAKPALHAGRITPKFKAAPKLKSVAVKP